jgi:glutathione S-transferase
MTLQLFGHPFSSYTMKALIALYENETPFDFRILGPDQPENTAELARRWPVARFPLLVDGGTTVFETSAIIEHLTAFHAGAVALIPAENLTVLTAYCADSNRSERCRNPGREHRPHAAVWQTQQ